MPTFDLRGIKIGKYTNTDGTITYDTPVSMGDAMSVELNLTAAEGRLYAESRLAEYKKLITGGTASVGVKYITDAAQKLLFGMSENTRNVGTNTSQKSLKATAKDIAKYVGMGFYAPDAIDGTDKYTAVFVYKVLFGAPGYVYATKGDSITFQTPTTTGEFLADDSEDKNIMEIAILASESDAVAWINKCFGAS
jgi:phi13 family phage major tail protein|nr:MAG TPA: tail tube protein [Caudoviricetes sp.]